MTIISHCTLDALSKAARSLMEGELVIFPTETVYGLGADAENERAVARIYEVKGRPSDHPVIVHLGELKEIDYWISEIPEYALTLAREFWPGSMTLILPRSEKAKDFITGEQNGIGLRIPAHPLALQLLREFHKLGGHGVAAPSANIFGALSPTTAIAALEQLQEKLSDKDLILDGGPSIVGIESTVIDCRGDSPVILRPGAITEEMVDQLLDKPSESSPAGAIRVSGSLESHYAPKAQVILISAEESQVKKLADSGFIANAEIETPKGAIRLASPKSNDEYARQLYEALRSGDLQGISKIYIVPPEGGGIATAIRDRIKKASFN